MFAIVRLSSHKLQFIRMMPLVAWIYMLILLCTPPIVLNAQQGGSFIHLPGQEQTDGGGFRLPGLVFTFQSPYVDIELLPQATFGTAVQSIGVQGDIFIALPDILILRHINFLIQSGYFYSFTNLGIPQASSTGFFSGAVVVSVGQEGSLQNNFVPLGKFNHNIIYQYQYFLDTIDTSQALGLFGYYYSQPNWAIGIVHENDALAFLSKDRFRSFALELNTFFSTNGNVWGVGLGAIGWGGTTEGVARAGHRGAAVDVVQNYGGQYSHGILYLAGYYDSFKLSIGIDSDEIRRVIQNGLHYFINQSDIAAIPNTVPRFYVQLSINPRFSLY